MSKFKVGDRVRVNDDFDFGEDASLGCKLFCILPHPIEAIDNGRAFLTTIGDFAGDHRPVMAYVPLEALILCSEQTEHTELTEQTEPTDRKTAFLEELRALLSKYDAMINVTWNEYFDMEGTPCIDVDFVIGHSTITIEDALDKSITADNIMDYDKERV